MSVWREDGAVLPGSMLVPLVRFFEAAREGDVFVALSTDGAYEIRAWVILNSEGAPFLELRITAKTPQVPS